MGNHGRTGGGEIDAEVERSDRASDVLVAPGVLSDARRARPGLALDAGAAGTVSELAEAGRALAREISEEVE